jgi:thiosulfate/3-mercaptopyruvate sulfurtransferase
MALQTLFDAATVLNHLDDPNWRVVDCRIALANPPKGRQAYLESHIPGAVYAHLDEDLSSKILPGVTGRHPLPDVEQFAARLSAWGIDHNVQVVAYDDANGAYASRLWWLLRWLGHNQVAVLNGGFPAWQQADYPVNANIPAIEKRTFIPQIHPELVVDASFVEQVRQDTSYAVVDSREAKRYAGEWEPIDPVAGHIPGALNAPFGENIQPDGHWLDPDALKHRFDALLGKRAPDRVVFYCGSGVTACHNVLAYAHAGLGDALLYSGSWSEWIADPSRPVAVG